MPPTLLRIEELGRVAYAEGLTLQEEALRARRAGERPDTLFLLEHPPVITLGRSSHEEHLRVSREELAAKGIPVFEAKRGGDVTYHGPGQLVGYPVLDLAARGEPALARDISRSMGVGAPGAASCGRATGGGTPGTVLATAGGGAGAS